MRRIMAEEQGIYEYNMYNDNTMHKVMKTLLDHGLELEKATDVISDLQNEGILFREVVKSSESNTNVVRYILNLSINAHEALNNVAELTGDSKTDSVSRAVILYNAIVDSYKSPIHRFLTTKPVIKFDYDGNGNEVELIINSKWNKNGSATS